jgi:hypothetical protein
MVGRVKGHGGPGDGSRLKMTIALIRGTLGPSGACAADIDRELRSDVWASIGPVVGVGVVRRETPGRATGATRSGERACLTSELGASRIVSHTQRGT